MVWSTNKALLQEELNIHLFLVHFNISAFPIKERTYKYTNNYFLSGILAGIIVTPQMFF